MTPVEIALFEIERRLAEPLTLSDVAKAAGVSRHHLARAFHAAVGQPVMRHLRARRMSRAAQALAAGAPDILVVALDVGYGSHEAFTRAFRDAFGVTPEAVRSARSTEALNLTEPVMLNDAPCADLPEPRLLHRDRFVVAGLHGRFSPATVREIPALWSRFAPWIGAVEGQIGKETYGVSLPAGEDGFDYVAAVQVEPGARLPAEFRRVEIAPADYAVFEHGGHVSDLHALYRAIFENWIPNSGRQLAAAPDFELYDDRFDPKAGTGVVEVWVPIKRPA